MGMDCKIVIKGSFAPYMNEKTEKFVFKEFFKKLNHQIWFTQEVKRRIPELGK
jgi:hypothetical protein